MIFLIFILGLVSGCIGAIAGGGGLLSIPILMFFGLPPQIAIATNKVGAVGMSIGALIEFLRKKKIIWKLAIPFAAISIVGGFIGANILINIGSETLTKIVGIILILLIPFLFIKDIGIHNKATSLIKKIFGMIIYFFLTIFSGFFGGGAGSLIIANLMFFFGLDIIHANAADTPGWVLLSITSLIVLMGQGLVYWPRGISLLVGMFFGGYIGAHLAIKKGTKRVKIIFAVVVVASAIKILFF